MRAGRLAHRPDASATGAAAPGVAPSAAATADREVASADPAGVGASRGRRAVRPVFSVRTRLTAVVALLVLIALGLAGLIVYVVEQNRLDEQTSFRIEQEFAELRKLEREGDYTRSSQLLDRYLRTHVPDRDEVLVSWYDGRPQRSSPTGSSGFAESALFLDTVRPLLAENGSRTVDVPGTGQARFSVQDVQGPSVGDTGALVIVTWLDPGREGLRETMTTYAVVAALALLLVSGVAGAATGRLLAPLRDLRATAEDISVTDLSRRVPVRGNDDITALTHTVNGMLARLEDAFAGQRRFLDDAGHELKTPLTVLRGHLEVLDAADAAEVAETRDLLLDEIDRMARLVGELILLAKSDRPDFLVPTTVEVELLTEGLVAKARGLADRRWLLDGAATGEAVLDDQRITQALLQLADNAVKHTADGTEIGIGSAREGDLLRFWVRDTGPGIPEADRALVFERFGRSVVAPHDEGFGLGLSIVRAIAVAHGGTVEVRDAHPRGAHVELRLPYRVPDAPDLEEDPWPAS